MNDYMIKPMKMVRRDILRLIQTHIEKAQDYTIIGQEFLPVLKNLVDDYQQSDPNSRDPEVLMLFAQMIKKMGPMLHDYLSQILFNLCETTLQMIQNDFVSYPEFRETFFTLVEEIVKDCTAGLFQLDSQRF
jgi:exportin-1